MESTPQVNRRQFFKYAIAGTVAGGGASYSPESNAFAFTAAAIVTGEKIGWAAYPPMVSGGEFVKRIYEEMSSAMDSTKIQSLYKGFDAITEQQSVHEQFCFSRSIEPITDFCTYSDQSAITISGLKKRDDLASALTEQNIRAGSHVAPSPLDIGNGVRILLNEEDPLAYSQEELGALTRMMFSLDPTLQQSRHPEYYNAPFIYRKILLHAVANYQVAGKATNAIQVHHKKVKATYHSGEWRESLNASSATTTLAAEYVVQLATENRLLFDILIARQIGLLIRCIRLIDKLEK